MDNHPWMIIMIVQNNISHWLFWCHFMLHFWQWIPPCPATVPGPCWPDAEVGTNTRPATGDDMDSLVTELYASLINKGIKGGGGQSRDFGRLFGYIQITVGIWVQSCESCVCDNWHAKIRWDFELLLMSIRRENETIAAACDGILEYLWVPSRSWSTNSRGSPNGSSLAQNDGPSHKTHKTGWVASRCHCFWWQLTERKRLVCSMT